MSSPWAAIVCLSDADDLMREHRRNELRNESAYYTLLRSGAAPRRLRPHRAAARRVYAEMTCCLYLPDVGWDCSRGRRSGQFEVRRRRRALLMTSPMRSLIRRQHRVPHGAAARPDRSKAFTSNPHIPATISSCPSRVAVSGGEPRQQRDGQWVSIRPRRPVRSSRRTPRATRTRWRVVVDGTFGRSAGTVCATARKAALLLAPDHSRCPRDDFRGGAIAAADDAT